MSLFSGRPTVIQNGILRSIVKVDPAITTLTYCPLREVIKQLNVLEIGSTKSGLDQHWRPTPVIQQSKIKRLIF